MDEAMGTNTGAAIEDEGLCKCPVSAGRLHYPIYGGPNDGSMLCVPSVQKKAGGQAFKFKDQTYVMLFRPAGRDLPKARVLTAVYSHT